MRLLLTPGKSQWLRGGDEQHSVERAGVQQGHQDDVSPHEPPRGFGTLFLLVSVIKHILHRRCFRHGSTVLLLGGALVPVFRFSHVAGVSICSGGSDRASGSKTRE